MFSKGSGRSISRAIVTPSFVIVGAPNFLSNTTLRPFGPSVTFTAPASTSIPLLRDWRACSLNSSFLATKHTPNLSYKVHLYLLTFHLDFRHFTWDRYIGPTDHRMIVLT